jgi:ankyrin repeat protein
MPLAAGIVRKASLDATSDATPDATPDATSPFVRIPMELKLMIADLLEFKYIPVLCRTCSAWNQALAQYKFYRAKELKSSRFQRPYFLRAVDSGNLPAVEEFIEAGASVDMFDKKDYNCPTALHSCVKLGRTDIAKLLLRHGVNLSPVNGNEFTALQCAAGCFQPPREEMLELLVNAGADISSDCAFHKTILFTATRRGTARMVKFLLERGAIPAICSSNGETLLHYAAQYATGETVRLFLEAGLNVEAKNGSRATPLHFALSSAGKDTVPVLVEWGANVNAFNYFDRTPLQICFTSAPSPSAAHRILHKATQADVNSWNGGTECDPECRYSESHVPVVDMFLNAGADIKLSRNDAPSALDLAIAWANAQGW